ncbi:MAG: aminotransferase class IV, partial [Ponticaulis sp.]|nr:aminotransferase class IV [Ponticaulis sp.]
DEVFITGTFAGVSPVREVDGRDIAHLNGPMTQRIRDLYQELVSKSLTPIT